MAEQEKKDYRVEIEFPSDWTDEQKQAALDVLAEKMIEHGVDPGRIPVVDHG